MLNSFKIVSWSGCFHYIAPPDQQVAICEDSGDWKKDKGLIEQFLEEIGADGWDGEVEW